MAGCKINEKKCSNDTKINNTYDNEKKTGRGINTQKIIIISNQITMLILRGKKA